MLDTSPESLAPLVSPLNIDTAPAAWWVTVDSAHLEEYAAFRSDLDTWMKEAGQLARDAGGDPEYVQASRGFGDRRLAGFGTVRGQDTAAGWRIDSKSHLIVPSRRTKADRESDAAKRFAALSAVPTPSRYVTGISHGLFLPGMWYGVAIARRGTVLLAFCNGDPDRADPGDRRDFTVDDTWSRIPLSTFHQLREREEDAA